MLWNSHGAVEGPFRGALRLNLVAVLAREAWRAGASVGAGTSFVEGVCADGAILAWLIVGAVVEI